MTYNEPIPDFETRFPNVLESCVVVPFQKFEKIPKSLKKKITFVGTIVDKSRGVRLIDKNGKTTGVKGGYEHFK